VHTPHNHTQFQKQQKKGTLPFIACHHQSGSNFTTTRTTTTTTEVDDD
jgi:hypothetical protein